jgi:dUTP pyrophosphatase
MNYEVLENELLFAKVKSDAIIPSKRDEDGWYDLYACFEDEFFIIPSHTNKLIPTGIASAFNKKWRMSLGERGSNTKSNSILMAGKIDSGYRGEIFVSIYNGNDKPIIINKNIKDVIIDDAYIRVPYSKAIAQFEMTEVPHFVVSEVDYEDLLKIKSERGIGALGSSNK